MDNRLGAYVALEAARRVAEAGDAPVDVVAVAAVQEEVGDFGARTAAFSLEPDVAIAIDVTYATDVPGGDPKVAGEDRARLGGRDRRRGPIDQPGGLRPARRDGRGGGDRAHRSRCSAEPHTDTDADAVHVSRAGVPTGLISVPLRYMHSPGEIVSLDDLEARVAARRRVRAAARARPRLRSLGFLAMPRSVIVSRCPHAVRQARRRPRRPRGDRARRDRDPRARSSGPASSRGEPST